MSVTALRALATDAGVPDHVRALARILREHIENDGSAPPVVKAIVETGMPTSIHQRHPFPWRRATEIEAGIEEPGIIDAAGNEVLGVSEWLRCDEDVMAFIIEAANEKATRGDAAK